MPLTFLICRRPAALLLAFATLVAAVTVVSAVAPATVSAAGAAPTSPPPACVYSDSGTAGLGCLPGERGGSVIGTYAAGGEFTIVTEGGGLAPCATYVSTGCYYTLHDPSLVRCVYLANNDANDVRSCPALSTQGSVSAQRQGACSGTLGSTYVYGGPANQPETYWSARAPKLANCRFTVSGDRPIDNLLGPTFYLVRTSVRECIEPGGGYGCDESWATLRTITEYAWLPVSGTLAPHAAFDAKEDPTTPGLWTFTNRSEPFADGATWEWTFGDGDTSGSHSPNHQYADPGTYIVKLTMRGGAGQTRSVSRTIEVKAPELWVSVHDPAAEYGPGKQGDRHKLGDTFTARVVVGAGRGLGDLTDVAPAGPLLELPEQLEVVGELPTLAPQTLAPGTRQTYEVELKAISPGDFTLRSTWNGSDSAQRPAGPVTGTQRGSVTGLVVTVKADPPAAEFEADEPIPVTVTVTLENATTDESFTNVTLQGPLDWGPLDADETLADVNLAFVDPEAVAETFESGVVDLGPLAPGAQHTYTYELVADGRAHAELKQLASAATASAGLDALGTGELRIGGLLLDFDARVVTPVAGLLPAGQSIRVEGTIENLADFAIQVGPPAPIAGGNAGAMSVVWDPTGEGPDAADVEIGDVRTLAAGESVDFLVRINTQWSDPRLYGVEPSGGTFAELEFTPWGTYTM